MSLFHRMCDCILELFGPINPAIFLKCKVAVTSQGSEQSWICVSGFLPLSAIFLYYCWNVPTVWVVFFWFFIILCWCDIILFFIALLFLYYCVLIDWSRAYLTPIIYYTFIFTWSGSNCGHVIEQTYKVILTCIVYSNCWLLLNVQRTASQL